MLHTIRTKTGFVIMDETDLLSLNSIMLLRDAGTLAARIPDSVQDVSIAPDWCDKCKEWGRTVTHEECKDAIPCPVCCRLTWPNLGVNLPAGAAVAISSSTHLNRRTP